MTVNDGTISVREFGIPPGDTHRSAALRPLTAALRAAVVCLAIVCCWADTSEFGEDVYENRSFMVVVPWSDAGTVGPDALPEIPIFSQMASNRCHLPQRGPLLAPISCAAPSVLPSARPIPRAPPLPIAAQAPARALSPAEFLV